MSNKSMKSMLSRNEIYFNSVGCVPVFATKQKPLIKRLLLFYAFTLSVALTHSGPTANNKTNTLKNAFDVLPEATEPQLSNTNHDRIPVRTVFRTASGALLYTHTDRHHIITPQPNKKPPVRADRNFVSACS